MDLLLVAATGIVSSLGIIADLSYSDKDRSFQAIREKSKFKETVWAGFITLFKYIVKYTELIDKYKFYTLWIGLYY